MTGWLPQPHPRREIAPKGKLGRLWVASTHRQVQLTRCCLSQEVVACTGDIVVSSRAATGICIAVETDPEVERICLGLLLHAGRDFATASWNAAHRTATAHAFERELSGSSTNSSAGEPGESENSLEDGIVTPGKVGSCVVSAAALSWLARCVPQ